MSANFGKRIRHIRRSQQRLLRDVAGRCGFTVSLLSKIESGKVNPPVATLAKIAMALGVQVSDLLTDAPAQAAVFLTAAEMSRTPLTQTDKGYGFHLIAGQKLMQPFVFVAKRGQIKPGAMTHAGEEFVYVLEGRMKYRVGATTYTLGPGDSLYFDSLHEHDLEPITGQVKFIAVFASPPAITKATKQKKER